MYLLENCDVIVITVEKLRLSDQMLVQRLLRNCPELDKKLIFVIHNYLDYEYVIEVKKKI
jgi:hypothetical protein